MMGGSLDQVLAAWAASDPDADAVAQVVLAMARTAARLTALLAQGELAGRLHAPTGRRGITDEQKTLDVIASDWIADGLRSTPAAVLISEESATPVSLNRGGPLIVAVDPIDGSSNIEANTTIGTIFSVLPALPDGAGGALDLLQPGYNQLAAGFFVYGPQTTLALTLGSGTQLYTLNRETGHFIQTNARAEIPPRSKEFAINVSNYRHWDDAVQVWLDDCLLGREGPRDRDFNMRWTASPVAEFYRILVRGGVFLYPGDLRPGYLQGRLRLIYEANAFAFIVEQAGGAATDGTIRILDISPESLHQHVPLVAGARDEVDYVARLYRSPHGNSARSPLFSRRGLMRS